MRRVGRADCGVMDSIAHIRDIGVGARVAVGSGLCFELKFDQVLRRGLVLGLVQGYGFLILPRGGSRGK